MDGDHRHDHCWESFWFGFPARRGESEKSGVDAGGDTLHRPGGCEWRSALDGAGGFYHSCQSYCGWPWLYYLFAGQSAQKLLTTWKAWLVATNATVMFTLLLVLETAFIGEDQGGVIG